MPTAMGLSFTNSPPTIVIFNVSYMWYFNEHKVPHFKICDLCWQDTAYYLLYANFVVCVWCLQ